MPPIITLDDVSDDNNSNSNRHSLGSTMMLGLPDDDMDVSDSTSALIPGGIKDMEVGERPVLSALRISHESLTRDGHENPQAVLIPNWKKYCGVAILFFINLLNYMDRYTIAGVLIQIQDFFDIENGTTGLLQTVFIISYMLVAPLFGYLGDRYNRKLIISVGMLLWCSFTLASSFIDDPKLFPLFLLSRALVGIGEASYSTIAPTLIGDMFVGPQRTRMLSVFFFATPIGSGLGFIVGSQVASAMGGWEWALRVTPGLGVVAIILLLLFCPDPVRGASEASREDKNTHSYIEDLKYLMKNKSFIYVTVGFTFMAFVLGSLTLWGPTYFTYAEIAVGKLPPCDSAECDNTQINFVFGLIACISGFSGVGIGAEWARRWKLSGRKDADPIVCAIGLLAGSPLLLLGTHLTLLSIDAAWVFVFFADLSVCLTWTLIGDMTLYICEPSRRSTANAVMLLIGHLFGDAGSPYLLGIIADAAVQGQPDSYMTKYLSLQKAMYLALFACVIGGWGFLMASVYIVKDKEKVDKYIKDMESSTNSNESSVSIPLNVHISTGNGVANGGHSGTRKRQYETSSPSVMSDDDNQTVSSVVILKS